MAALPGVEEMAVEKVCDKLASLGVLTTSDIEFVESKDIEEVLPPIQCRKLIQYFQERIQTKNNSLLVEESTQPLLNPQPSTPSYILIDNSSQSTEHRARIIAVAPYDWAESFEINWDDFPKEILLACENKTRPQKKYISEMVRIIVSRILKIDISPGRRNLQIIAKKIVNKYPETFQDSVIESVIAGGAETLRDKLEDCIDNRKRRSALTEKFASPNEDMPPKKKRKTARDSLGCINWQPVDLPLGETKESQHQLKSLLVAEFEKNQPDAEFVKAAMNKTYAMQRFFINSKRSITEVRKEWPFLLNEKYILLHFEALVGKDILKLFRENLPLKCRKIYEFMRCQNSKQRLSECVKHIDHCKERLQNSTPEILGAFLLLLAYFEEDERFFLQIFKDLPNIDDVENQCPVLTPFLGVFGGDIYNAEEYVVFLDGKASTHTDNVFSAVAILFSAYYVFNIEYPTEACVTMEFIQRVFAEINPDRGTKCPKNKNIALKKVLNLSNKLMCFQNIFNLTAYSNV